MLKPFEKGYGIVVTTIGFHVHITLLKPTRGGVRKIDNGIIATEHTGTPFYTKSFFVTATIYQGDDDKKY